MVSSYASLLMGKFEKYFLDSCCVQPLLHFRLLDYMYIFVICGDGGEKWLPFV